MPADPMNSPATLADRIGAFEPAVAPVSQFGNYEILGELARGGVGVIYKARQRGLERIVALKVLQGGTFASADQVKRFLTEAQSAAKLQHPNIVPIHDFGVHEGQHFFTMDFIEGKSLADLMAKGPMPVREALAIVRQTAEALHYAHEHGVVHRDVKPGNILLDEAGRVKVTDFGIAKELDREQMHLTVEGQVMGTPRYMSPEQASGRTALADRRSDVFSLGSTLYEMLTGQPAFDAEAVLGVLQKVVTADPPPPHRLNARIHRDASTICMKSLEKAPAGRYQTAQEMADDIHRFLEGEPIEARPVGPMGRAGRKLRRHWKVVAANVVLVAAASYAVFFYLGSRPARLRLDLPPFPINVALDDEGLPEDQQAKELELKPGPHTIHTELEPTYDPQTIAVTLKPGELRTIPIVMRRRQGRLVVTTDPPDAAITVLGPDKFHAPFRGPRVEQDLPTGPYAVLVHQENFLAQRLEVGLLKGQTQTFHCALLPVTLWAVPTSGNVLSVPAVADVDGDGWGDVLAGDDDGKIYCLAGKNGVALWVFNARDAVQAPLSVADLNRDGVPDVIVGGTDGFLYALNGRQGQPLWTVETRGPILGPALLRDVIGDGVPDVFAGSADGTLYAVNGADGQSLWKLPTRARIESCLAWAREGDTDTLLVGNTDRNLLSLDPRTGKVRWEVNVGAPLLFPPRFADGGGTALLPTPLAPGDVRTHTPVRLADHSVGAPGEPPPTICQLDGTPVTVNSTDKGTSVFAADGKTLLWSCEYQAGNFYTADINRDGTLDLVFNNGPAELMALSGKTGAILGRITLERAVGRGWALDDVDRDGVPDVVVGAGQRLYCFSWVGGRKRWAIKADGYYDAPAVALNDVVIAKSQTGELVAHDAARGEPRWRLPTSPQTSPYSVPAAADGLVADADAHSRQLRVFDADKGALLWSAKLPGDADAPIGSPAIGHGWVIVGDGHAGVSAFAGGTQRWTAAVAKVIAAPAIGADAVLIADTEQTIVCLALADGTERWRFRSPTPDPFPVGGLWRDINHDGVEDAVALNDAGLVYALDGRNGQVLWKWEHSASRARTRNRLVAAPGSQSAALANPKGNVTRLDLVTGKPSWTTPLRETILGEPSLADLNGDGVLDVIVGTMNRRVHCLSGTDGARLWTYEVGGQIRFSAPVVAGGLVIVGTGPPDNTLYALRGDCLPAKPRDWSGPWRELTKAPDASSPRR